MTYSAFEKMYYHYHKTLALVLFATCLILSIHYYNNDINTAVLKDIEDVQTQSVPKNNPVHYIAEGENFLIDTPKCFIPNYGKHLAFKEPTYNANSSCGQRAIFIKKLANDKLLFHIDKAKIKKYSGKKKFECCYRFASRSTIPGRKDGYIDYTTCKPFKNGSKIKHNLEVLTVTCVVRPPKNRTMIIYEDAYMILKKIKTANRKTNSKSWNVLLLGIDTMSRARLFSTMPSLGKYLQQNDWLDYKAYQKVGFDALPNLISLLTGMKMDTIYKNCNSSTHRCNDYLIWSMFKNSSYVTAYGKDNLQLPDTFFPDQGFESPPTDHYMRPLFLTGEKRFDHIICTKKMPSAKHLLDYAYQFIDAYKKERYFGMFWINSYSRSLQNLPSLIDKDIVNFFEKLQTDALKNTFVLFLSNHGLNNGEMRYAMYSYYEERLPMFFVWVPSEFKKLYPKEYSNMKTNQNRLITPYDVFLTLSEINRISNNSTTVISSEACPQCKSLFEEISKYRTCADASVNKKWCSCHNMSAVDVNDNAAEYSVQLLVSHIQKKLEAVKTINCMACHKLSVGSVLRTHSYKDYNNTYYVVALQMSPGKLTFEATILNDGEQFTILEPTETISSYNVRGNCAINPNDRKYCVCKLDKCNKNG